MFTKRKDKCCNGGKQHKFKARYAEKEVAFKFERIEVVGIGSLRNTLLKQVYICDVCEWCGSIANLQTSQT